MEVLNLHSRMRAFSKNPDPKENRSAVKAACYRAGDRLFYVAINRTIDYSLRQKGIDWAEIVLPHTAPDRFAERETLWNEAEAAENRQKSLLCREFEVQIPREFDVMERINLIREFVQDNFVAEGMIADFAIHNKESDNSNPHAHILLTTRRATPAGFAKTKERAWDDYNGKKGLAKKWRKDFASRCNTLLKTKQIDKVVEYRKFSELGIDQIPTIHEGKDVTALEKKGVKTNVRAKNEDIRDRNAQKELERQAQRVVQEHSPNLGTQILYDGAENERIKEAAQKFYRPQMDVDGESWRKFYENNPRADFKAVKNDQSFKVDSETPVTTTKQGEGIGKKILNATEKIMSAADQTIQATHDKVVEPVFNQAFEDLADDVAKQFGADPREVNFSDLSLPEIVERLQQMRGENKDLANFERLITGYDNKISDLQHRKNNLSIYELGGSRWLDDQIKAVEISKGQAVNSLQKDYGITPDRLTARIETIQTVTEKLNQLRADLKREQQREKSLEKPEMTRQPEKEHNPNLEFDIDF